MAKKGYKMSEEHKKKIGLALCGNTNSSGKRKETVIKKCFLCCNEFTVYPYREKTAKFCSQKCQLKDYQLTPRTIERRKKMSLAMKGRGTKFGDGIPVTPFRRHIRTILEYKLWREHIYQRDDYTCQECKQRGKKLNADHIIPFSCIMQTYNIKSVEDARNCDFLWDIRNGRTLCEECHMKTPTWAGKGLRRKVSIKLNHNG